MHIKIYLKMDKTGGNIMKTYKHFKVRSKFCEVSFTCQIVGSVWAVWLYPGRSACQAPRQAYVSERAENQSQTLPTAWTSRIYHRWTEPWPGTPHGASCGWGRRHPGRSEMTAIHRWLPGRSAGGRGYAEVPHAAMACPTKVPRSCLS